MAEGVLAEKTRQSDIDLRIDSCGTGGWHVGDPPDNRAQSAAASRNYLISHLRARQVGHQDFMDFDLIVALDDENYKALERMNSGKAKLVKMLDYLPKDHKEFGGNVPDPYYEGNFEHALDLIEAACEGILSSARG